MLSRTRWRLRAFTARYVRSTHSAPEGLRDLGHGPPSRPAERRQARPATIEVAASRQVAWRMGRSASCLTCSVTLASLKGPRTPWTATCVSRGAECRSRTCAPDGSTARNALWSPNCGVVRPSFAGDGAAWRPSPTFRPATHPTRAPCRPVPPSRPRSHGVHGRCATRPRPQRRRDATATASDARNAPGRAHSCARGASSERSGVRSTRVVTAQRRRASCTP